MTYRHRTRMSMFLRLLTLAVAAVAGCGQTQEASVSGTVTLDGKPLTSGTVAFHPTDGGPLAYAGIHPDGSYKVSTGTDRGLAAGDYVVTVTASEKTTGKTEAVGRLLTPRRYGDVQTSDLRFKVTAGSNRIDLRLTSP